MRSLTLSAVCHLLKRFDISYKRGRQHVHSPDLLYDQKLAKIRRARELAVQAPDEVVFLYEDEITVYSRPTVGRTYGSRWRKKGDKATGGALKTLRIAGCIDVQTGAVITRLRSRYTVKEMYRFFSFVEKQYPQAKVIYIALDNWPVHFHAYVQEHLAKRQSRIRLLSLLTYAPWTNPQEKVWHTFSRDILTQHGYGLQWDAFKTQIKEWFQGLREGSAPLLHEVGLLPDYQI